jgi:hypothetical protein
MYDSAQATLIIRLWEHRSLAADDATSGWYALVAHVGNVPVFLDDDRTPVS